MAFRCLRIIVCRVRSIVDFSVIPATTWLTQVKWIGVNGIDCPVREVSLNWPPQVLDRSILSRLFKSSWCPKRSGNYCASAVSAEERSILYLFHSSLSEEHKPEVLGIGPIRYSESELHVLDLLFGTEPFVNLLPELYVWLSLETQWVCRICRVVAFLPVEVHVARAEADGI